MPTFDLPTGATSPDRVTPSLKPIINSTVVAIPIASPWANETTTAVVGAIVGGVTITVSNSRQSCLQV